jgi:hypothetical protein
MAGYLDYMVLIQKTKDKDLMTKGAPFGPGFGEQLVGRAETMEVYGTSFSDEGDRCSFVLRDANGKILAETTINGY